MYSYSCSNLDKLIWLAETLKKDSPFAPNIETNEPPLRPYQLWKKARYKEAFRKSDQMHKTFEKSSLAMTHKLDDIIKLPKSLPKKTIKDDLEYEGCGRRSIPQSTPQVLLSFKVYTSPVTYPEEVDETLGTPMEEEPLDQTKLEDVGLTNHSISLSSREVPSFDEPEPQSQPLPSCPSLDVILDKESPEVLWIFTWTILDDDLAGLSCFFSDIEQNQGSISFSRFSYFSFIRFQLARVKDLRNHMCLVHGFERACVVLLLFLEHWYRLGLAEGVTSPTTVHYVALILDTNSEPFEAPPSPDYASAFDDDTKLLDAPTTPPPAMLSPRKRIRAWRDQEGLPSLFELRESSSATHVLSVIEKEHLVDKLIRKFNKKIVKCQKRVEKANQQSKDFENQNKDLQDKYNVLKNQTTNFEMNNKELNEQLKELIEKNNDLLAQTKLLKEQLQVKHVVIDTHVECHEKYAKIEAERYEYMIRYSAYFDNDKQHRKQIADQQVLFDKMSVQIVELDKHVRDLKNTVLEKDFKISEWEECVRNKDLEIEKYLECLNVCENKLHKIGQTNQTLHMIMPSKDNLYNGRKGIGFENPSYFEKAKDLRPTLYDEKIISLGYTLMFLTHSDKALEIEKFKRSRENKIEFAYDYVNLNASYVIEKINLEDDYFQEIINPDFDKIDSPFQQTRFSQTICSECDS
nr:ribonuclease H-like domain-containing protein [Tanacetum cinerariifolium]